MARVITIANNKGGTGKTTTAVNLAAGLRLRGYDVLIIDYDGQANVTQTLRVSTANGTIYRAMQRGANFIKPVEVLPADGTAGVLCVLPASGDLAALETELANKPDRLTRFGKVLDNYRYWYDVIIIDTPPTLGLLTISALYATDQIVLPAQPHYLALKGLLDEVNVIATINKTRKDLPKLEPSVLITQYDGRKTTHRTTVEAIEGAGLSVYKTKIRDNVALSEAPAAGKDIFAYDKRSHGAEDYAAFVSEYLLTCKLCHYDHRYK